MDNMKIKNALEVINEAILEQNNHDITTEDFYWWGAVLGIFNYKVDGDGSLIYENNH